MIDTRRSWHTWRMGPRPLAAISIAALAVLAGCASEVVSSDDDTSGSEGEPDCPSSGESWTTVRTDYPQMSTIWSDGERFVAHGDDALLIFDGQSSIFHRGVTDDFDAREIEASGIDDVWLVGAETLYHWDGVSAVVMLEDQIHPNLEVAADGQVWLVAHEQCDADQCQPQLWRYQGEDVWDELSIPELPRAHSFWAGADGELWLGHAGLMSHRTSDGAWEIVDLVEVGYEGAQPQLDFVPVSIDVDAQGNVWALSAAWGIYLARRTPQGEWQFSTQVSGLTGAGTRIFADGERALIHHANAASPLYRWTIGTDSLEMVATQTQLGIDAITDVDGPVDRLHVLSPEPRIQRLDTASKPVAIDEVEGYPALPPAPGGAASVDATFVGRGNTLYRFDGERWRPVLRVPSIPTDATHGFTAIEAVSDDGGWMIAGSVLWRWRGDALTEIGPAESGTLRHVWPISHESAWVFIDRGGDAVEYGAEALEIWRVDGDELQLEFEWPTRALAVTGDEQQAHAVTLDGMLLRGDESGWAAIGDPAVDFGSEYPWANSAQLALVGDELLLIFRGYRDDLAFTELSLRWDGNEWSPASTPLFSQLRSDRLGRAWGHTQAALYRHDGQQPADTGWVGVELELPADARINPASDGVMIHGESSVSTFRWACE